MSPGWKERLAKLGLSRKRRAGPRVVAPARAATTPEGRDGEDEAGRVLQSQGVSLLARNARGGGGELGLVAAGSGGGADASVGGRDLGEDREGRVGHAPPAPRLRGKRTVPSVQGGGVDRETSGWALPAVGGVRGGGGGVFLFSERGSNAGPPLEKFGN